MTLRVVLAHFVFGAVSRIVSLQIFLRSVSRSVLLRDFLRSGLTHCVIARFICVAISCFMSLRDLFAKRSHALCRYEVFLRSISRVVSLRDFLRSDLTRLQKYCNIFYSVKVYFFWKIE